MAQFCGAALVDEIDLTGRVFFVPKLRREGGLATRRAIFLSAGGGVAAQHRGRLSVADSEALFQDDRPTSGATIATHSSRFFQLCCAGGSVLSGASCWPSTELASKPSTTTTAIPSAARWRSLSVVPRQ